MIISRIKENPTMDVEILSLKLRYHHGNCTKKDNNMSRLIFRISFTSAKN